MTVTVEGFNPPHRIIFEKILLEALKEDWGRAGDITSSSTIPEDTVGKAKIVAKEPGRIAGLEISLHAFTLTDPRLCIISDCRDGQDVDTGEILARVEGPARSILAAERVVLNLLGHLSGIASQTREIVNLISGTSASVVCTRKTTPGLRSLEKYAVRCGGGKNHRYGLDDAVLIKENHIAVSGGITAAVTRARECAGHMVRIEVEVENLQQLDEALSCSIDAVLLDNMDLSDIHTAVARVSGQVSIEVSGGITRETVADIAQAGVDIISIGALTHSVRSMDVSLSLEPAFTTQE